MLLFWSEEHVDRWCKTWKHPRGEVFSVEQQWGLAVAWYADRMDPAWRRKTVEEAQALFTSLGLTSDRTRLGLSRLTNLKMRAFIRPGSRLVSEVRLTRHEPGRAWIQARGRLEDRVVSSVRLELSYPRAEGEDA